MKLERHAGVDQLGAQREIQEQRQREVIVQRSAAFKAVFSSQRAAEVLEDLSAFCCANRTTVDASATNMAVLEGRRQVWLHIQQLLNS